MNYKIILFGLILLILACGVQSVFAGEETVNGYKLTVPDDYTVTEQGTSSISLGEKNHNAHIIIQFNVKQTPADVRAHLSKQGSKYIDNKTYDFGDYKITQLNFQDSDGNFQYMYLCKKGDETIGINMQSKNEQPQIGDNGNPLTGILSSIKH